jgi:hypothetical protein
MHKILPSEIAFEPINFTRRDRLREQINQSSPPSNIEQIPPRGA